LHTAITCASSDGTVSWNLTIL